MQHEIAVLCSTASAIEPLDEVTYDGIVAHFEPVFLRTIWNDFLKSVHIVIKVW
jgi:hypothetical protein